MYVNASCGWSFSVKQEFKETITMYKTNNFFMILIN